MSFSPVTVGTEHGLTPCKSMQWLSLMPLAYRLESFCYIGNSWVKVGFLAQIFSFCLHFFHKFKMVVDPDRSWTHVQWLWARSEPHPSQNRSQSDLSVSECPQVSCLQLKLLLTECAECPTLCILSDPASHVKGFSQVLQRHVCVTQLTVRLMPQAIWINITVTSIDVWRTEPSAVSYSLLVPVENPMLASRSRVEVFCIMLLWLFTSANPSYGEMQYWY